MRFFCKMLKLRLVLRTQANVQPTSGAVGRRQTDGRRSPVGRLDRRQTMAFGQTTVAGRRSDVWTDDRRWRSDRRRSPVAGRTFRRTMDDDRRTNDDSRLVGWSTVSTTDGRPTDRPTVDVTGPLP